MHHSLGFRYPKEGFDGGRVLWVRVGSRRLCCECVSFQSFPEAKHLDSGVIKYRLGQVLII